MDMQTFATLLALMLAGSYLVASAWRSWKRLRAGGCSSSCGCTVKSSETKQPGLVQVNDLTARLRSRTSLRS